MVAPGRTYCHKHYIEQKVRNERKQERKIAGGGSGVRPGGGGKKRKNDGSEDDEDWRGGGRKKGKKARRTGGRSEDEEEASETEYLVKRILPPERGTWPPLYGVPKGVFEFDEDDEGKADPHRRWRDCGEGAKGTGRSKGNSGGGGGDSGERSVDRPCVARRSSLNRKRREFDGGEGAKLATPVSSFFVRISAFPYL